MNTKLNDYINKLVNTNHFSHAYLIEVDDSYNSNISIDFAKRISSVMNKEISDFTDDSLFDDLRIIRPEGKFIKKEQLLELMTEYKTKSLNSNNRVYVIEYAENLNTASANTILKFLEEPDEGIVAILITKNRYNVIDTIVSRCQYLNIATNLNREYDEELHDYSVDLFRMLVTKKEKAIAYLSEIYSLKSDQILKILLNISIFYENIINIHYNIDISDKYFKDEIRGLSKEVSLNEAVDSLKKIEKSIKLLEYNVNPRIVLDRLFYEEDSYEGSI